MMERQNVLETAKKVMRDNKELFDALGYEKPIENFHSPEDEAMTRILKLLPKTDMGWDTQIDIIARTAYDLPGPKK